MQQTIHTHNLSGLHYRGSVIQGHRYRSRMAPVCAASGDAQRKVWRIRDKGSISNLQIEQEPCPDLAPGEALVAVKSIGLNFADVFSCLGLYSAFKPFDVPGLEFSGVVTAVASEDDESGATTSESSTKQAAGSLGLKVGDRVVGVTRFGAFASHVKLNKVYLRRFPDGWSYQQAASFPVQVGLDSHPIHERYHTLAW